jgi:hypothetical protein
MPDQEGHVVGLALDVIELQDGDVALTTIAARVRLEMRDDHPASRLGDPALAGCDLLSMGVTPLAEVRAEALATPVLEPGAHAIEGVGRKGQPTAAASLRHLA